MTLPSLHAPTPPPGWQVLTGPALALLAEISDADERMPHLRAAIETGRFDDALLVLGRAGGPPSCAAALLTPSGSVRVVVARGGYAEALVGGRRREILPPPELGWADVVLDDVVGLALLARAAPSPPPAGMPPAPGPVAPPTPSPSQTGQDGQVDTEMGAASVPTAAPPLGQAPGPVTSPPPGPVVPPPPMPIGGWVPPPPPIPVRRPPPPFAADAAAKAAADADAGLAGWFRTADVPSESLPGPPFPVPEAAAEPAEPAGAVGAAGAAGAERPQAPTGVSVLALLCPAGHVTPAHSGTCRHCGLVVAVQEPFSTPRPALGELHLSTGDVVILDRGVLLGRAPRVEPDQPAAQRPHVVKVSSPLRDVSRNHLEVVLDGWHVLVRDLATTNGTTVTLPGGTPVRLLAHDQQVIEPGTVVSLADEVTFTYTLGD